MRIDRKRLEQSIDELGRIGETPRGGLTRLALTDDDKRGRDLMVRWMREAGRSRSSPTKKARASSRAEYCQRHPGSRDIIG